MHHYDSHGQPFMVICFAKKEQSQSRLYSQLHYSLSVLHYIEIKYENYNTIRRLQGEH